MRPVNPVPITYLRFQPPLKGEASITALRQETLCLGQTLEVTGWNYEKQLHKKNATTNGIDGKNDEKTKIGRLLKRGSLPVLPPSLVSGHLVP